MTAPLHTEADRPVVPKPYAAPALVPLGTIDAVTAGPSSAGELDTLFGGDGGFRDPDGTS